MTSNENDCKTPEDFNLKNHWDKAYTKNSTENLGWYEESAKESIDLIEKSGLSKDASILNVGVGSSVIIDELLEQGYTNLIANDFSEKALKDLKVRLNKKASNVSFVLDDLTKPTKLLELPQIDMWNDRAVLHFFLKEEEQNTYFNLVKQLVKANGFVVIAVFAVDGAEKCCGLPLQRYDVTMLQDKLGEDFELKESFNHVFTNPYGGERPYIYALFQRKSY